MRDGLVFEWYYIGSWRRCSFLCLAWWTSPLGSGHASAYLECGACWIKQCHELRQRNFSANNFQSLLQTSMIHEGIDASSFKLIKNDLPPRPSCLLPDPNIRIVTHVCGLSCIGAFRRPSQHLQRCNLMRNGMCYQVDQICYGGPGQVPTG